MPNFYFTPASVSYLAQCILTLAITVFLLRRLQSQRVSQPLLLSAFFALGTVFIAARCGAATSFDPAASAGQLLTWGITPCTRPRLLGETAQ
ncbi:MAG: hypothetical protein ACUVRJ_04795 [Candidatus Villigracilaceae bacterium]